MGGKIARKIGGWLDQVPWAQRWIGYWVVFWLVGLWCAVQLSASSRTPTIVGCMAQDDFWHLLDSAATATVCMTAVWTFHRMRPAPGRTLALVCVILVVSQLQAYVFAVNDIGLFVSFQSYDAKDPMIFWITCQPHVVEVLTTCALLLATWCLGIRMLNVFSADVTSTSPHRWQFSLRELLSWVTVTAIALGLIRFLATGVPDVEVLRDLLPSDLQSTASFCMCASTLTWLMLGRKRFMLRLLLYCVAMAGYVVYLRADDDWLHQGIRIVFDTTILIVPLSIARRYGCRLVREQPSKAGWPMLRSQPRSAETSMADSQPQPSLATQNGSDVLDLSRSGK